MAQVEFVSPTPTTESPTCRSRCSIASACCTGIVLQRRMKGLLLCVTPHTTCPAAHPQTPESPTCRSNCSIASACCTGIVLQRRMRGAPSSRHSSSSSSPSSCCGRGVLQTTAAHIRQRSGHSVAQQQAQAWGSEQQGVHVDMAGGSQRGREAGRTQRMRGRR